MRHPVADATRSPRALPWPLVDSWTQQAACRGLSPSLFYADRGAHGSDAALAVCMSCLVRRQCLAAALSEERGTGYHFGVRGGTTGEQRRQLGKQTAHLVGGEGVTVRPRVRLDHRQGRPTGDALETNLTAALAQPPDGEGPPEGMSTQLPAAVA
jgi:WhiB family redox-sensing transcriptional regulator